MCSSKLLPVLLCLCFATAAAGATISFDEQPAGNSEDAPLGEHYAALGVHFASHGDGALWDGRSQGDPGRWGLEGRQGSAFIGFNGHGYRLAARFDAPVRALRLDVAASRGAAPGTVFTLEGYREGRLVERSQVVLGGVDEWITTGLDAEIDALRWRGEAAGFHPFGVDRLRWLRADSEPRRVDIEVRPGTQQPLDPTAGGLLGAVLFGDAEFPVEEVDETTLALGPDGAGIVHPSSLHYRDIDEDGWQDLVAIYRVEETGIAAEPGEACLTGESFEGVPFEGCTGVLVKGAAD